MTCVHTFHAGLLACLALPCLTEQARAALSACGGDPFLARISICSCTPDFCQRNFHLARIRRFDLLHSAAERRQSENSAALPLVRLVHCALPPGLIAALRLQCTLQAGSSASFTSHYCSPPAVHIQTSSTSAVPVPQLGLHREEKDS
jgi:hypothetical protein